MSASFFPTGTPTGYTYLEEYLHWLAIPHAVVAKYVSPDPATFVDIDLRKFTSGFALTATYSTSNSVNGIAVIQAYGHTARFTPTAGATGRGKFSFTVNDGDSWTQNCGVVITASGLPRDLSWKGDSAANNWDTTTSNWRKTDGTSTAFSGGDTALFDNRGISAVAVNLTGAFAPSSVTVNSTQSYIFSGVESLSGAMPLTKSGSGTLTVSMTNTFTGGTTINEGTLITNNVGGLGTGKVTLGGSTLSFTSAANQTFANAVAVTAPSAITTTNNTTFGGAFSGAGNLSLSGPLLTPTNTWVGLTGTVTVSTGTLRFNQGGNPWGAANASFNAGTSGTIKNRSIVATQTINLGALSGGASSFLVGSDQTGSGAGVDTYLIGALNIDSTFFGTIQNGGLHTTAINKTGAGALLLGGTSSYTGNTTVSNGSLVVSGSLGNTSVPVASPAVLAGSGTIAGPVTFSDGSFASPATDAFTGGILHLSNNLTLGAATVYCDLYGSPNPPKVNDSIALNGGSLTFTAAPYFQFLLLDGALAAGNYDLITGAGSLSTPAGFTGTFANNLPSGSRQTFTVKRSSTGAGVAKVWLEVLGDPGVLT